MPLSAVKRARGDGFRVVHFSVQHNHVHLIVEANDRRALSNAMRALLIRVARGLNRVMQRTGKVLADRFHLHVLRSACEALNAVRYALNNLASHAARRGESVGSAFADPYGWAYLAKPRTWLLRVGGGSTPVSAATTGDEVVQVRRHAQSCAGLRSRGTPHDDGRATRATARYARRCCPDRWPARPASSRTHRAPATSRRRCR